MKALEFSAGFLLKLDRGEEVTGSLERFLAERTIHAGTIWGLGGVADAELGYYDLASRTYERTTIPGNLELIHYAGNITLVDGAPFIHAHAIVSGPDLVPRSGHFFQAQVTLTGEFVLNPADWTVERLPDETTGLKLWHLPG